MECSENSLKRPMITLKEQLGCKRERESNKPRSKEVMHENNKFDQEND